MDQRKIGSFPDVIPDVLTRGDPDATSSAGWGDAGVIIPWTMYLAYGDTRLLGRQYPSMWWFVDYQHNVAGDALPWKSGWHYGDWLAYSTVRADYPGATTDKDLIATAFFAHSADLVARSAAALGTTDDARTYRDLFERIKAAWNREYMTASGRMSSNTQTAYALALQFHLLPESGRADAGKRLAANVRRMGHLTTGFIGTPYLTNSLSETDHLTAAYQLLLNKRYPSWLRARRPSGSAGTAEAGPRLPGHEHELVQPPRVWRHRRLDGVRVVTGLDLGEAAPGYLHVVIHPQPAAR